MRRTSRSDKDFRDEIEAHLQLEIDQLQEEGMSRREAEREARRKFGNMTRAQESFYETNRWMWLDTLAQDLKLAWRQLKGSPLSTLLILASLALAIGINTSVFSIADQTLMRTLPVSDPEKLVQLEWEGQFVGQGMGNVGFGNLIPFPLYRELKEQKEVFSDLFARSTAEVHLSFDDSSQPVTAELVTGSYFRTLGIRQALGRVLDESDDLRPEGHPQVVLSHAYWQNALASDPDVVGRTVRINSFPMTVVGVAQRGFQGTDRGVSPAVFIPMMMKVQATPGWSGLDEHRTRFAHAYGRLSPDMSREQAQVRLQTYFKNYLQEDTRRENWPELTPQQSQAYFESTLELRAGSRGHSHLQEQMRQPLLILMVTTGLVFLLACLNVANLSMARALTSRRATALRTALGAPRRRLLIQQLTESAVLAIAGCSLGLMLAPIIGRFILSFLTGGVAGELAIESTIDPRVVGFAIALSVLTTLLAGATPAFFAASAKPIEALKRQGHVAAGGLGTRRALVIGQFALALVLLLGAGLFSQTLGSLREDGPGYSTSNLVMFTLAPQVDGMEFEEVEPMVAALLQEIQSLPDVESAGAASFAMLSGGGWNNPVTIQDSERVATEQSLPMNAITPGFFEALGARITQGRDFDDLDAQPEWNLRSAIVNDEFVRRYVEDGDPVGAQLGFGNRPGADVSIEIVGVVSDFQDYGLREPEAQVYFSLWERSVREATFYVRARTSSEGAMGSIRQAISAADPRLTVLSLRTLDDQLDRLLATERLLATLASIFALLATLLAMFGLYGVLAFSAERRTKEMGIRLALGANRWSAGGLILKEASHLALWGLVLAIPIAVALGQLVKSQLFGVQPLDPMTWLTAIGTQIVVGALASLVPARRVGLMDPLVALRTE